MTRPKLHDFAELPLDRAIAPVLVPARALPLGGVVLSLTHDVAHVAAVSNNLELVDWVRWLTKRPNVIVYLVSRETFSRLIDELGLDPR